MLPLKEAALIVATSDHVDLAYGAVKSAREGSRAWHFDEEHLYIYDDATPAQRQGLWNTFQELLPEARIHRFSVRAGCTAAWNAGLRRAKDAGCEIAVITNDDVIFSPGWDLGLEEAIETYRYQLVGPVTNAPGTANPELQQVKTYLPQYQPSDHPAAIANTASQLARLGDPSPRKSKVNGFCMAATVKDWWAYAFDEQNVFNPTYRVEYSEDDYQKRGRVRGMEAAVCPGSFVFHYRSATRGEKFRRGLWLPRPEATVPMT